MTTSRTRSKTGRVWLRRGHRWLGLVSILFVLLLSTTGIALNHSSGWGLDSRFIRWAWLLDAYGIHAPAPSASFTDRAHRATLLGQRLYFDAEEVAEVAGGLQGMVVTNALVFLAADDAAWVLTTSGELVQAMEAADEVPAGIRRVGRAGDTVVLASNGTYYRSDSEISAFKGWPNPDENMIAWSRPSAVPDELLAMLQNKYRGSGLSIERLLADVHSGRILPVAGLLVMDGVAILLIILGLTGLLMWIQHDRRDKRAAATGSTRRRP